MIKLKILNLSPNHFTKAIARLHRNYRAKQQASPPELDLTMYAQALLAQLHINGRIVPSMQDLRDLDFTHDDAVFGYIKEEKSKKILCLKRQSVEQIFYAFDKRGAKSVLNLLKNSGIYLRREGNDSPFLPCSYTDKNGRKRDVRLLKCDVSKLEEVVKQATEKID